METDATVARKLSKGPQYGISTARSASNTSKLSSPSARDAQPPCREPRSGRAEGVQLGVALNFSRGEKKRCRTMPTWFSTWPFSQPAAGVQARGSTRWWLHILRNCRCRRVPCPRNAVQPSSCCRRCRPCRALTRRTPGYGVETIPPRAIGPHERLRVQDGCATFTPCHAGEHTTSCSSRTVGFPEHRRAAQASASWRARTLPGAHSDDRIQPPANPSRAAPPKCA